MFQSGTSTEGMYELHLEAVLANGIILPLPGKERISVGEAVTFKG